VGAALFVVTRISKVRSAVEDIIVWKEIVIMIMRTFSPVQDEMFTKPNAG
jgi:hypothetical protein